MIEIEPTIENVQPGDVGVGILTRIVQAVREREEES